MTEKITLSIANHLIGVEGAEEVQLLEQIAGFSTFAVADPTCEWQVVFGRPLAKPASYDELYQSPCDNGVMSYTFAKNGSTYWIFIEPYDTALPPVLMKYELGSSIVEANHCDEAGTLRFVLWLAFGMLACSKKMVLIHSSCVVHQGKAVLCLGESGTGKSTHTRLWLQHIPDCHLLNDDCPVMAVENGEVFIYGSPWSGKTHCYHQQRYPMAAAIRLSQAPYNKIKKLSVFEAFSALHPSCPPALAQDDKFQDMMMDMLSEVLSQVPVFHLACLPDESAAWTSHDAIFGNRG